MSRYEDKIQLQNVALLNLKIVIAPITPSCSQSLKPQVGEAAPGFPGSLYVLSTPQGHIILSNPDQIEYPPGSFPWRPRENESSFSVAYHGKESTCQYRRCKRQGFDPWVGKIPWSRKWQPTPVSLPGKSHGQRSLAGYSP